MTTVNLIILTGASGSGKTAIAKAIASRAKNTIDIHYFDSIGVPADEKMIAEYGSGEEWQKAATNFWMAKLSKLANTESQILFEGQMRLSYIVDAAASAGITDYSIILVDCNDEVRTSRLSRERGQPGLANPTMMNWAKFLRDEATKLKCKILDTSSQSLNQSVDKVLTMLNTNVSQVR